MVQLRRDLYDPLLLSLRLLRFHGFSVSCIPLTLKRYCSPFIGFRTFIKFASCHTRPPFLSILEVIQPKIIIYLKRKIESTSNSSRFLWLFTNTYLHSWEKVDVGERVGKRLCYYAQKWVALYCLPLVININCHLYYLPVLQSKQHLQDEIHRRNQVCKTLTVLKDFKK